ncbi:hypothetical protein JRO89_XS08G0123400 [Xanthoceras sorbifolium]|uniref:Uncharacterized protein n=1 Tax=Xanthoceras sorbifolium TaxID=99658 RepID=A0ABQ8HPG1_9ROSI|nr:hypothetical protein JRO89_XS08G0123400 [Xanthoceras sorbifolium]
MVLHADQIATRGIMRDYTTWYYHGEDGDNDVGNNGNSDANKDKDNDHHDIHLDDVHDLIEEINQLYRDGQIDMHMFSLGCEPERHAIYYSGPWITFTEYPEEEFEILFACFKEAQFTYTCSEDELQDAFYRVVKNGYSKWMFQLRLPVFKKYVSVENRITHCPDNIPPPVWKEMVGKWMKKE